MQAAGDHCLIRLRNGSFSVHSLTYGETMHPAVGPMMEAEELYVRQLLLGERCAASGGPLVVWDIGLGAAANATAVLAAMRDIPTPLRLVSFENTTAPLEFALEHPSELPHLTAYAPPLRTLLTAGQVCFQNGRQSAEWTLVLAGFPAWLAGPLAQNVPAPDAILFDPYSPAKNPEMWTLEVFTNLFRLLDPARPCVLATYSRSTLTRVSLLLAGFHVGAGQATGLKEETTLAANTPCLLTRPLDRRWLERARRSDSAEPLRETGYRRAPLSEASWARLQQHPQFASRHQTVAS